MMMLLIIGRDILLPADAKNQPAFYIAGIIIVVRMSILVHQFDFAHPTGLNHCKGWTTEILVVSLLMPLHEIADMLVKFVQVE